MAGLVGCVNEPSPRFSVDTVLSTMKVTPRSRTIAVDKVTLPSYAKETNLFMRNAAGALVPVPQADWADDPERALSLTLVRNLTEITGAKVALDPWPLDGEPEADLRVEVEEMIVNANRVMTLSGQYAVRRGSSRTSDTVQPFSVKTNAASLKAQDIVAAHAQVWKQLAERIAKSL
ncbi:conserved hypothetical protein [Ahrensia sp. R2A130]|nr:conserved hypothetical protein [Ahrensia sp. R2A130]